MKYILTSGCSFTNNVRLNPNNVNEIQNGKKSWPYYLKKELGKGYKVLNYGGATNDNVSICRILLYHAKRLISEGIPSSDIILIGQGQTQIENRFGLIKNSQKKKEKSMDTH
jgi:hypothetical protein